MAFKRREFLLFLGAGIGTAAISNLSGCRQLGFSSDKTTPLASGLSFEPIRIPIPLDIYELSEQEQMEAFSRFEVADDLVLPPGHEYQVIAAWGDPVGDSRFGYNNDYVSFVETAENEGFLTVNFEYISGKTWMETYEQVLGKSLPFNEAIARLAPQKGAIDAFNLEDGDLKNQLREIAKEGLIDMGVGVISLKRNSDGTWERTNSQSDRRITGASGLDDDRYLVATGPGVAIFEKSTKLGYEDGLGNRIIGTFQNCAGGTTPWGTVLSAEENFQGQVIEPVLADGSAFSPSEMPFVLTPNGVGGYGNVFGLAGNKYGWMVEVDPADPQDYGTKHTWLGRYRHEAVGIRAVAGKPLAVYSGCDRRGGHLYKFLSEGSVVEVHDKANSRLLESGMLYGAKFNPDGTGTWIPLNPETAIDPVLPSEVIGKDGSGLVLLPNPDRNQGGIVPIQDDTEMVAYREQFQTLGDLYFGDDSQEKQGAILIDAHFAANAAGVTCTARPEDTDVAPDGSLYISFTSGSPGGDGGPDRNIFVGPNGEIPYEFGWIMRLREDDNDPAAMSFRWEMMATGGEPSAGGLGFANPDNLAIIGDNVWLVTDMSTGVQNAELKERQGVGQSALRGIFGNNSTWLIPTSGEGAGIAYPFAIGPMETETTGPFFSADGKTLFVAVQHPGERNGTRKNTASETRQFALLTTNGQSFMQERQIPLGSNWPSKQENDPPRPAVVAIRRQDDRPLA